VRPAVGEKTRQAVVTRSLLPFVSMSLSPTARREHSENWPGHECRNHQGSEDRLMIEHLRDAGLVSVVDTGEDHQVQRDHAADDTPENPARNHVNQPQSPGSTHRSIIVSDADACQWCCVSQRIGEGPVRSAARSILTSIAADGVTLPLR